MEALPANIIYDVVWVFVTLLHSWYNLHCLTMMTSSGKFSRLHLDGVAISLNSLHFAHVSPDVPKRYFRLRKWDYIVGPHVASYWLFGSLYGFHHLSCSRYCMIASLCLLRFLQLASTLAMIYMIHIYFLIFGNRKFIGANTNVNHRRAWILSTVTSSGTSAIDRRTSTSVQLLFWQTSRIIRHIISRVIMGPVRSSLLKIGGSNIQGIYSSEPGAGWQPTPHSGYEDLGTYSPAVLLRF